MGVIAAEYRCCLAVSNDLRDGVQAVLGRVRRLPHPDQRVNAGGVQRVFTVDYARPAQAQHGVGFVNGDELFRRSVKYVSMSASHTACLPPMCW